MAKHLPKRHSLHLTWMMAALAFMIGGMIIQSYLTTVLELERQNLPELVLGASVGSSASVPANPDNTLAAQLSDKEMRLDQREAELALQELAITRQVQQERNRMLVYLLIGAVIILALVALNFYFDYQYRHEHEATARKHPSAKQRV